MYHNYRSKVILLEDRLNQAENENKDLKENFNRDVAKLLGLKVDSHGKVFEYHGFPSRSCGVGWKKVCHIDDLQNYLLNKLHKEHKRLFNKEL